MRHTLKKDLELERQLKLINKTPIKIIHTKSGQIVDCIDIRNQPAFDHPLLQNHKLQRKPSFKSITGKNIVNSSISKPVFGLGKNQCPTGTIPIRRTTKDDLIRGKSVVNYLDVRPSFLDIHHAQVVLKQIPGSSYFGVRGTNSIYNPRVNKNQSSLSHMWVQNGSEDDLNAIVVGWQVSPDLYGDDRTYLFTFWTSSDNSKKTGCYNVLCPGFIQIDKEVFIGGVIDKTSVDGGPQFEMTVSLSQDNITKNWWVIINDINIGYFPAALFSNLNSASLLGWGGRTTTPHGTPSPPMGSGQFPDDHFSDGCYFKHISYQDESSEHYEPDDYLIRTFTDKPNCFGAKYYGHWEQVEYSLIFGGPGGECGN
ncbi:uncharacterized protein LOC130731761 [Lotus japonicus]|uniref:uncharacterized protein LOC130731761 n=1 Tax=Lotus japonicus TaxID=34305 RepID=UPI00258BD428|nr:uncharacterized protein LOC130731761 [Lotus japonicus]